MKANNPNQIGEKDGVKKRQFYEYVKQRTKSRPSIGPLKDRAGRVVQEEREMAEAFNEFFSIVFTRENVGNVPDPNNDKKGDGESQKAKERGGGRP